MQTILERLKIELKMFDGYKWGDFNYSVDTEQKENCIIIWWHTKGSSGLLCLVYSHYTDVLGQCAIPHKLTMLIAKALRAPSGMYKAGVKK